MAIEFWIKIGEFDFRDEILAVFTQMGIVTRVIQQLDRCHRGVRMIGQLRGGIMSWIAMVEFVQVRALDGLVFIELQQGLGYGEPLSLPADSARVFPLRQLLGHSHNPHFRSMFVLLVL